MVTQGRKKNNKQKKKEKKPTNHNKKKQHWKIGKAGEKVSQQAPLKMAKPNCSLAAYIMHLETCEPLYLHGKHNRLVSHKTWLAVY